MAYTEIQFKKENTGEMKKAPVGFSWTTAFFGIFPALFRGDFKWGLIMALIAIITFGLSHFVFMFIYNKLYIKKLIEDGYKAESISNNDFNKVSSSLGIDIPVMAN
jgi:hypothetical protein